MGRALPAVVLVAISLSACSGAHQDKSPSAGAITYSIAGTVSGLQGSGLTLRTDRADVLIIERDGPFAFGAGLEDGDSYRVSVVISPSFPAQQCVLVGGTGVVIGADVTDIRVSCTALPTPLLQVEADVYAAKLSWNAVNGAAHHNLVVSTDPDCTAGNYSTCPDGRLIADVTSPHRIAGLRDRTKYYFRLETIYSNASRDLSQAAAVRPTGLAIRGHVTAMALAPDGTTYLGGDFHAIDIYRGAGVPLDAVTGEITTPDYATVGNLEEFNVTTVVPDRMGGWYIGGQLTSVGGEPRDRLAHIRADGSVDPDWKPSANGWVRALLLVDDTVYIAGDFTSIDGQPRNHLAAVSVGGHLLPWNPESNGEVRALAARQDTIYIGGWFSEIAGATRNGLAAVGVDGTLLAWNPDVEGGVLALAVDGDTLYVGGGFSAIGGVTRHSLAAFDTAGILLPWNPSDDGFVSVIEPAGDTIYIVGRIAQGSETRNGVAAIDEAGALRAWNPVPDSNVWTLTHAGDTVYLGGYFNSISGVERHRLAAIDADGNVLPWNPQPNGGVWALAAWENTIYVGGDFSALGPGFPRERLAALAPDGSVLPWNPQADGNVAAIALAGDTVYVGGSFQHISGEYRGSLAAIRTDGTLLDWAPRIHPGGSQWPWWIGAQVETLAVADSTVYVGGVFAYANDQPRTALAAFDLDGNLTPWNPDVLGVGSAYTHVSTIAAAGNTIYFGGTLQSVSGQPRQNIAAVDSNGALLPWNPGADNPVSCMAASGSTLYVSGMFQNIAGTVRGHAAAFSADGALLAWDPRANNTVSRVVPVGTTIYLAGYFEFLGSEPRFSLGAVDTRGAVLPWNPHPNSIPHAIAVADDGVHLGGWFTDIGGEPRFRYGVVSATTGELLP